jgi:aryl-alcohol dehydrogenase-like predicted oxidoreductase
MEKHFLGKTDIKVSLLCLGTMTFGEQNTESQAHAQLDYALEAGINFIDTAEVYPVPLEAKTYGLTETYIGSWIKKSGKRSHVILASKVAGYSRKLEWVRDGQYRFDRKNIEEALEASLKRLQTDYLDWR